MDSSEIQKYKLIQEVCRCCLNTNGAGLPDRRGDVEDMLKETFNIELTRPDSVSLLFCEGCTSQLRQARVFKQLVLRSEQTFSTWLSRCTDSGPIDSISDTIKTAEVKTECVMVVDDFEERCDNSSLDDEPLSVIRHDIGDVLRSGGSSRTTQKKCINGAKNRRGRVKKKARPTGGTVVKDWAKLVERRGNGPILRENSLKLVENSTICVFQWHKSKYTCFCCKQPFQDIQTLRQHTTTEHNLQNIEKKIIRQQNQMVKVEVSILKCKLCDKTLESLQILREHLTMDHAMEFKLKEDLLIPFKIEDSLSCQICHEKFTLFRLLNIHMNKHYKNQVCYICGASFSNLKFLNLHKTRLHRPLKCQQCDVEFVSKTDKRQHDVKVHDVKITRKLRFPCPDCDERFVQENFKVLHMVERHGMKRPEFRCSVCPKTFVTKSLCNNHVKSVHMKERVFNCGHCQRRFRSQSSLRRHQTQSEKRGSLCVDNSAQRVASPM